MGRHFVQPLSSSFLFFFLLFVAPATAQNAPTQVRVGVILNLTSAVGQRRRTGIQMAVEDYYAAHPGSSSRVVLHFADSSGDVVRAASAAVDLIKNAQVQAIIGPQTSAEAEFIAYIGNRTHVPVLSFSATSSALSPWQTPFFVRAAANDSSQAAPIADVLDAFKWRAVVLVYEDSPYGTGILPALVDALQGVGTRIMDRTVVPTDTTDDRLDAMLYHLMAMPTRVFVVHMSPPLAARLFHRVKIADMMSKGYAWIATAGVGSVVDRLDPTDVDAMQGVVSLRPYVHATRQVKNFTTRFKARFRKEYPSAEDIHDPSVLMLWAYDAAWAAAVAAEAARVFTPAFRTPQGTISLTDLDGLGVSATGATLLNAVLNTSFDGLSGKFRLVDGQLQLSAYEIVNVIGKGMRTVGFWTPEAKILRSLDPNSTRELKEILWPGETSHRPRGWDLSPNRRQPQQLQIDVPVKHGFQQFVHVSNGTKPNITGYCIDVFDAVLKKLPYPVYPNYVPFNDSSVSYDNLVRRVTKKKADAVVGDTTITASRMAEVDFTMPFTDSGWSMVVAVQNDTSKSMWIFLQPLTTSLWLTSVAFFFFTGLVVWVIEHRINPEFRGTPWQQFGLIFYFAFSTLVFSHKEKLESNLSRFVVIIWVFVVLILTSSYTASLTSMLTVQKLQPTVTDMKELLRRGDYVGYQEGSFLLDVLKNMGFHKNKLRNYGTAEQYADALSRGSANGGVSAIFDEIPYLKVFLWQYCNKYTMVGPIYKTVGFGFIFPKGSPLVPDVSQAILKLAENDEMARIEKKWLGESGACLSQSNSIGSSSLSFESFGGLFLITGVVSVLTLLVYLAMFVYQERHVLRAVESNAGRMSLRRMRAWLQHYDRKDMKAPTFKTWLDESARNGSDANQVQRAREEEAMRDFAVTAMSPISLSACSEMNTASVPEEMSTPEDGSPFEQRIRVAATPMEMEVSSLNRSLTWQKKF